MNTTAAATPLQFDPALSESDRGIIREEVQILQALRKNLARFTPAWHDYHTDESLLELRDSLGEAHEDEIAQIVAQMESLASLSSYQRLSPQEELPLDRESPYFGHLRVKQDGRLRDILIGNRTLTSPELPYPIIDWRNAPISKVFYCYQEGEDYEEKFGGKPVEGTILALRKVLVVKGNLLRIDCPQGVFQLLRERWVRLRVERPSMHGGAGSAVRADSMGAPRLGGGLPGAGEADRHLPIITGLIDAEQFRIITAPNSGVVVIDGGAGSGKTTIALHRIAYLAYGDPQRFRPEQMLVVVFNKGLAAYVSQILPALGVKGVPIQVLEDFLTALRRRHFPDLDVAYSEAPPTPVMRFKQHPATWRYLLDCIQRREAELAQGIRAAVADTPGAPAVAAAWQALADIPLALRLERMVGWARGKVRLPGVPEARADWLAQQRLVKHLEQAVPAPQDHHALVVDLWQEAFLHLAPLREGMERVAPGEFSPGDLETVRDWAFRFYSAREEYVTWHADPPEPVEDAEERNRPPEQPRLDREDDPLLLLLYRELVTPLQRPGRKKPFQVAHLMVDEAQDFSPLELRVLLSLAADPPSVTLAGDTDQRMLLQKSFTRWEEVLAHVGLKGTAISPLKVGYRSTREIMEFARHVLGPLASARAWQATRHGLPVELLRFAHPGQAVAMLADALKHLMRAEPTANVALVARYPAQAQLYYEGLAKTGLKPLRRVAEQDFSFQPGIEVTDVSQVKGLEYDYVVLLDVDQATYPDDDAARYLLHIGATRAAHQLWLVACRTPSPLLPSGLTSHLL